MNHRIEDETRNAQVKLSSKLRERYDRIKKPFQVVFDTQPTDLSSIPITFVSTAAPSSPGCPFSRLPDEVIYFVLFGFLDRQFRFDVISLVCKRWYFVIFAEEEENKALFFQEVEELFGGGEEGRNLEVYHRLRCGPQNDSYGGFRCSDEFFGPVDLVEFPLKFLSWAEKRELMRDCMGNALESSLFFDWRDFYAKYPNLCVMYSGDEYPPDVLAEFLRVLAYPIWRTKYILMFTLFFKKHPEKISLWKRYAESEELLGHFPWLGSLLCLLEKDTYHEFIFVGACLCWIFGGLHAWYGYRMVSNQDEISELHAIVASEYLNERKKCLDENIDWNEYVSSFVEQAVFEDGTLQTIDEDDKGFFKPLFRLTRIYIFGDWRTLQNRPVTEWKLYEECVDPKESHRRKEEVLEVEPEDPQESEPGVPGGAVSGVEEGSGRRKRKCEIM